MIEVAVALKTASTAFNLIQKAVHRGGEIQDLADKFSAFFDQKDKIAEAEIAVSNASMAKKFLGNGSIESQALQITMAKHKTQQMEKELRELILYTVGQEFYLDMMRQRSKLRQERLRALKAKAERKKLAADVTLTLVLGTVSLFCIIYTFITVSKAIQ